MKTQPSWGWICLSKKQWLHNSWKVQYRKKCLQPFVFPWQILPAGLSSGREGAALGGAWAPLRCFQLLCCFHCLEPRSSLSGYLPLIANVGFIFVMILLTLFGRFCANWVSATLHSSCHPREMPSHSTSTVANPRGRVFQPLMDFRASWLHFGVLSSL